MRSVNTENWTYTQYTKGPHRALISIGADLTGEVLYYTTILDEEDQELFQKEFSKLEEAADYLNIRCKDRWDFTDASKKKASGGCDSCVAH